MDLSFTGVLSYCEDLVMMNSDLAQSLEHSQEYNPKGISKRILKKKNVKNKSVRDTNYT